MSAPYYPHSGQGSASGSPYRPGTADGSWDQGRMSTSAEARPDLYGHMPTGTVASQVRPEPLQPSQQQALPGTQMGVYIGQNVVTPRQSAFPRDQLAGSSQYGTTSALGGYDHTLPGVMTTDTPRAAHFGSSNTFDAAKMSMGPAHALNSATGSAWPGMQQQADSSAYGRYAYPTQTSAGSWSTPGSMSMSQNIIYDTSSSANTSPNHSQSYYDMSGDHFDHSGYGSHMGSHTYPMYGPSTSKMAASGAFVTASQPEYQPEEIDSMLNQVSTLYKTANTKKMAEFYRDKWARMWLTCNYTLKPSIQISIPRTILHESYRRACDSFGLEPLQAASFGKVLRSQFPDVAQRRLGGRGKTRFHYCGFGTSNEREAAKVKSLLEDEKAGKLQLSAGLSAEYAAKARSEGHEGENSYRAQPSSEASPVEGYPSRAGQYENSPHASSDSSVLGSTGATTDDRLIASAFATLNSSVLTPPGTGSNADYNGQDAARYAQAQMQNQTHGGHSSNASGGPIPRRHTVSHSYSGLSDLSFLPPGHPASDTGDAGLMHSGEMHTFGASTVSGISEPAQSASLLNSPASSLHGYQYVQDPRHVPSSMPFRRSCQDLPDWPTMNESGAPTNYGSSSTTAAATGTATLPSESRKAWREYESLCQALLYSIYLGPDPVSFEQRTVSFWNSLNAGTREALRSDTMLHGMILRADGIIFRQLLSKLDGMIGDDVADERMPGLRSLAKMLAEQMIVLIRDALPEACMSTKVQASKKMSESLERIIKIFEAIRTFREESMLDVGSELSDAGNTDAGGQSALLNAIVTAGSVSQPSTGMRNPSLAGALRGNRPRSGTQTSMGSGSMARPLANFPLRRRDNSISSTFSDSQSTWASGDNQRASSSASESENSSNVEGVQLGPGMPNNFYAPLARKATTGSARSRMASTVSKGASDASGGFSNTFSSLALVGLQSTQMAAAQPQMLEEATKRGHSSIDSPLLAQSAFQSSLGLEQRPSSSSAVPSSSTWSTAAQPAASTGSSPWSAHLKSKSDFAMQG